MGVASVTKHVMSYGTHQLQLKCNTCGTRMLHMHIFSHIHTITCNVNYLRVQAYTRLHYLFTRKVHFSMHTRMPELTHVKKSTAKKFEAHNQI